MPSGRHKARLEAQLIVEGQQRLGVPVLGEQVHQLGATDKAYGCEPRLRSRLPNVRELDLMTAIISVWSLTRPTDAESAEEALDLARVLKPHREESEVRASMDELRSNGTISMDLPGNQAGHLDA